MSHSNDIKNQILAQWLKKKGSKLGFYHKCFCVLTNTEILIYKKEYQNLTRKIKIQPDLETKLETENNSLHLTIIPKNDKPITLAADEEEPILNWTQQIRNLLLITPNMSIDNFEIVSTIARGYYGKVLLAKKKGTSEYYAIKTIHKSRLVKANKTHTILVERNILAKTNHPFIIGIRYAFQTDTKLFLALEYAPGGSLFNLVQQRGTIKPKEVKMYIAELSMAINYLHNNNIIYRDLKSENVLLDAQGYAKLTDFGLAKILTIQDTTSTFCGTNEYIAPEIINKKMYNKMIDWWSLGILTYELLYGNPPFRNLNNNINQLFDSIRNDTPHFPDDTDQNTKDFIMMLLNKNPEKRKGFQGVFNHPFFDGLNFKDLYDKKIQPDYIPPLSGPVGAEYYSIDLHHPDNVLDSLTTPPDPEANEQFQGFSYAGLEEDEESSDVKVEDSSENENKMMPSVFGDLPPL